MKKLRHRGSRLEEAMYKRGKGKKGDHGLSMAMVFGNECPRYGLGKPQADQVVIP